jgi:signal transduction histidine kinase
MVDPNDAPDHYLAQFYESIDVGENGSITLVGTDGVVRARGSKGPSTVGVSLADTPLFAAFAQANSGHYDAKSRLDGLERLFVYRKVKGYPLVVVVGLADTEIFSSYVHNRNVDIAIAALLTVWLLGVTYLVTRYQRMLAKTRDAAKAGTRARSEFLAMMSHEIRTPFGLHSLLPTPGSESRPTGSNFCSVNFSNWTARSRAASAEPVSASRSASA